VEIRRLHSWKLTRAEATALQKELAGQVDARTPLGNVELVAAADISNEFRSNVFHAGVVVLRLSDMQVVERRGVVRQSPFPYHPGLLTFREAPAVLDAFERLETSPDVVIIDGHGVAHPRRCGFASHVGLWLGVPTVGFAKTLLVGAYEEPGPEPGDTTPLLIGEEVIGTVLRTKRRVRPVFVSVGNRVDLESATRLVLECCRGYRLPEPIREAHAYVNSLRRAAKEAER
jgi:deoxyribonuclease V